MRGQCLYGFHGHDLTYMQDQCISYCQCLCSVHGQCLCMGQGLCSRVSAYAAGSVVYMISIYAGSVSVQGQCLRAE